MKIEFSRQIFEKYTGIKFHENPLNGSRVVAAGRMHRQTQGRTDRRTNTLTGMQTDGHDETQSRFSQFCERD